MFDNVAQSQNPTPPPGKPDGGSSSPSPIISRRPAAVLEVPAGRVKPEEPGLVIHAIPKEYYDVAPKIMIKKSGQTAPATLPPLPPPPPKPTPPPPSKAPSGPKKKIPVVLIIGIILLVVVALGGFLFLQSLKQPAAPPVVIEPEPEPIPEPMPEPEPEPEPEPIPEPIRPGVDTDSDGLTDVEEIIIFKSDPRNPDSDGDSFIDGNEVFHLYDPTKPQSSLLESNSFFEQKQFRGSTFLVPVGWVMSITGEAQIANFELPSGERFQIASEMSPMKTPTEEDLHAVALRETKAGLFIPFQSKTGYQGLRRGGDEPMIILALIGQNLAGGKYDQILTTKYELGSMRTIDFLRTLEMIVNSINYD